MKIKEVRELSITELNEQVYLLKEQLFHLRAKQATGQLTNGRDITKVRKDIARVYTILRERELGMK